MTAPELFWSVFSGVLAAGLLIVMFVASGVRLTKKELRVEWSFWDFAGLMLPLAFLGMGLYGILY